MLIYISQRVDIHSDYNERRDALDQRWASLLLQAGHMALPIFNHAEIADKLLKYHPPGGIILSGGNNPQIYGGNAPERDEIDAFLTEYAVKYKIPLLGVCRGMQSIVLYFDGLLHKVKGHTAVRHMVNGEINREVNSYHNFAPKSLPEELYSAGRSSDGEIECIKHKHLPIMGIMWHPEREIIFNKDDLKMLYQLFI